MIAGIRKRVILVGSAMLVLAIYLLFSLSKKPPQQTDLVSKEAPGTAVSVSTKNAAKRKNISSVRKRRRRSKSVKSYKYEEFSSGSDNYDYYETIVLPEVFWGYLKLTNTLFFGHNHPQNRAVIKNLITSQETQHALNDILPYGSKVIRILKDRVTLEKDGKTRALKLTATVGDPERKKEFANTGYQQVTYNEWLVRPNRLLGNNERVGNILRETKIRSVTDTNGVNRFQIKKLQEGNIMEELGVEEGDTINKINGTEITGIKDFVAAYKNAKDSSTIRITLERDQTPIDIFYQIVPDGEPTYSIEKILLSNALGFNKSD